MRCVVAGAGGFIGGHLVGELLRQGHKVRAVDIKPEAEWWQTHRSNEHWPRLSLWPDTDLRLRDRAFAACVGQERVYNLAADMGGIGYIETHRAECMVSSLINTHLLLGAVYHGVKRYFYASSACVYHAKRQHDPNLTALREEDAFFGGTYAPEPGYGEEKLFSERMCHEFMHDPLYKLDCRVARFHNVYGPKGSWNDGREKAPAALCRKMAQAKAAESRILEIWGNGSKTRSFCWVGDAVEGICRLMDSDVWEPLNIGSSEVVSIGGLVHLIEEIAGYKVSLDFDLEAPQGVAGRNSDNTKIEKLLGWQPTTSLREGLEKTYHWIFEQVKGVTGT